MRALWLLVLLVGCEVSPEGAATPGSASAEQAAGAQEIARRAAEIEQLSANLESEVDEGRRRMAAGQSTLEQEVARYRGMVAEIEAKDKELQAAVQDWEGAIPAFAGVPTPAPARDVPPAAPPPPPSSTPTTAPTAPPTSSGIHIDDPESAQQGAPLPR